VTTGSVTLPSLVADLPRYNSNLGRRLSGAYPPCSDKKKPQRGRAGASLLVRLRRWGGSGMRQRRYACDG